MRIVQTPAAISISYEMIHDTRIIPLDGRKHLDSGIRQYMGDARGHFEGNGAVGHALSGERAFDREAAEAVAKAQTPPKRAEGLGIYGRPREGAEIFNINAGE